MTTSKKRGRKPVPSHRQIICRSIGMMAADWARAEALAERLDMSVTELARQAILSYIGSKTEDAGRHNSTPKKEARYVKALAG